MANILKAKGTTAQQAKLHQTTGKAGAVLAKCAAW